MANARLFSGALSSVSGNLTVTNAIGLHLTNGWATGATNKYVIWNEDSGSAIVTNGPSTLANVTFSNSYTETVYSKGNVTGGVTLTPNSGTIQKMTLTGDITLNGSDTGLSAGKSMTLILQQDITGGHTLTSNMLFAGGSKTLSLGASAIDILNIFYDGTYYYASLVKGYA
jgi:hypothetical protein